MLLTISTTHQPATDLGYLLHKNPAKVQSFTLNFGAVHVFYPEVSEQRCTMALMVEVDPVGLVRNRRGPSGDGGLLEQYVNDRPYAASSLLSVAIAEVLGSALGGRSKERVELIDKALPFEVQLPVLPCKGGEEFLRRLFEPLGYQIESKRLPLDARFVEWGESNYFSVRLTGLVPLHRLLSHLYVLIPVLDNEKHYWVGDDEVDKLLRRGEGWLATHPERESIALRYLKHRRYLAEEALERLTVEGPTDEDVSDEEEKLEEGLTVAHADDEQTPRLNEQRMEAVLSALVACGAESVVDIGCGEGRLLRLLLKQKQFRRIVGMDVAFKSLELAKERMNFDQLPTMQQERIKLLHGSLMYRDERLSGFDAAAVVEVIEHLDAARLAAFERVLFEFAKPSTIVLTTPNREYNVMWESLPAGKFRHRDHRFEWTRREFQDWANGVAERYGYQVRNFPVGPVDEKVGSPTQMAIFERSGK